MTESNASQPGGPPAPYVAPGAASENLLRHYANVVLRRWPWIALGLIVGLVAGVASTLVAEPAPVTTHYYKATNTLVQTNVDRNSTSGDGYSLGQAALQVQSLTLLDMVGDAVGTGRSEATASLSATVRPNVNAIDVTGIATQPEAAVRLADTAADTLIFLAAANADGEPDSPGGNGFDLKVLQPASAIEINARGYSYRRSRNLNARSPIESSPTSSSAPEFDELDLSTSQGISDSTRISLGAAAGLVLGLISVFVIEAWDDRVRRRDRVEDLTGLGVLTEIPRLSRAQARGHHVAVEDETAGAAAERFRAARTAITFAMEDLHRDAVDGAPVLMVTSPNPAEGKTTTVANLAAAFADDGNRVLVIDGDFRRPTVRRYLTPVPNLVSPDEPIETRITGVSFLAGPHDAPTPEVANDRLAKSVAEWRREYDLVLLDTPPILTTNDAVDLLDSADAVVLVLRADRTRGTSARRVADLLRQYRANVLGVVLNSCDRTEMNQYYGYGNAYGYGYLGKTESKHDDGRKATSRASADDIVTDEDAGSATGAGNSPDGERDTSTPD